MDKNHMKIIRCCILLYIDVLELWRPVDASNVALLGRLGDPLGGSWGSLGVSWGPEDGPGTRLGAVLTGCQENMHAGRLLGPLLGPS